MGIANSRLTILFENPFWIGLYEREDCGQYEVCKITFGAEPKDQEVYLFLMKHWNQLKFSPSIQTAVLADRKVNPKRIQRSIRKQLRPAGVGTKAQQALRLQREQEKQARKVRSRAEREEEQERQFQLRKEKRREKHKGH